MNCQEERHALEHRPCQGDDLAALRYHWAGAYKITGPEGVFRAERRDGLGTLVAATGHALRVQILADYLRRPVPRSAGSTDGDAAAVDSQPEATAAERLARIDALDMEPIVYKLMHPEPDGEGLPLTSADQDVALYRCFWKLCLLQPTATLVPTRELDQVWHTHMLDTVKYRADCDWVFGYFLDHYPYFGFRGPDDQAAWLADFAATRRLFREHFGVELATGPAASACATHGDLSACCIGCAKPREDLPRPRPDRAAPGSGETLAAAGQNATPS
jgi:hypothetical protein